MKNLLYVIGVVVFGAFGLLLAAVLGSLGWIGSSLAQLRPERLVCTKCNAYCTRAEIKDHGTFGCKGAERLAA